MELIRGETLANRLAVDGAMDLSDGRLVHRAGGRGGRLCP